MKVFPELWIAGSLSYERKALYEKASEGKLPGSVFAVVLPDGPGRVLEIMKGPDVRKFDDPAKDQWIVGLASSKDEAVVLSGEILNRVLERTGGTDVRAYLAPLLRECK